MVPSDVQGACSATIPGGKLAVVSPTNVVDLASIFSISGEVLVTGSDELSPGVAVEINTSAVMAGSQQAAWGDLVAMS